MTKQHLIGLQQTEHQSELSEESKKEQRPYLVLSGISEGWWSDTMECCCYLRNLQDLLPDGRTMCEKRFNASFGGQIIPSEHKTSCKPISPKEKRRCSSVWQQDVVWHIHRVRPAHGREIVRTLACCGLARFMLTDLSPRKYKVTTVHRHVCVSRC